MTKSINTLVSDIYSLVNTKGWFDETVSDALTRSVSRGLQGQFQERDERPTLRLSRMGPQCPCALWYSIHHPECREAMPPWAEIKFSYGYILEAYAIALTKAAGHEVTGEQRHVELDGIVGHIDCIIDGNIVDVKSSSSRSFIKFKDKSIAKTDSFGYLDQLAGYIIGSRLDPDVSNKNSGYLLAIDKQLGHICLYEHWVDHEREAKLKGRIADYKRIIALPRPPSCECRTIPQGASGNIQLDTRAGYSPYKYCCRPYLRTFLYASGPVFLTHVVRKPDVPEIPRPANVVPTYH